MLCSLGQPRADVAKSPGPCLGPPGGGHGDSGPTPAEAGPAHSHLPPRPWVSSRWSRALGSKDLQELWLHEAQGQEGRLTRCPGWLCVCRQPRDGKFGSGSVHKCMHVLVHRVCALVRNSGPQPLGQPACGRNWLYGSLRGDGPGMYSPGDLHALPLGSAGSLLLVALGPAAGLAFWRKRPTVMPRDGGTRPFPLQGVS